MRGLRNTFSRSIAAKVITSTVLLSLGVVWLAGSALNSRLSDGIRSVNLNSSIAEARLASVSYTHLTLPTTSRV